MSAMYAPDCDFVVVHRRDGIVHLEEWKMGGRLERAMRDVVADVMDGRIEDESQAEFALGFVAAIDALGHGRLRLDAARDHSELASAIDKAWRSTLVADVDLSVSTVFADACAELSGHREDMSQKRQKKSGKSRKGSRK